MQIGFRVKDDVSRRLCRIPSRAKFCDSEFHRRLFMIGLDRVENGVEFGSVGGETAPEIAVSEVRRGLSILGRSTGQVEAQTAENLALLHAFCDVLLPDSEALLAERVAHQRSSCLLVLEQQPTDTATESRSDAS